MLPLFFPLHVCHIYSDLQEDSVGITSLADGPCSRQAVAVLTRDPSIVEM